MTHAWRINYAVMSYIRQRPFGYFRPATLARELEMTRGEAELALWYARANGQVACRPDGRWHKVVSR